MTDLTAERLREVLHYAPETGWWTWLICKGGPTLGTTRRAGSKNTYKDHNSAYRRIMVDGRFYPEHRLAFLYMTGHWPAGAIDHVNRNGEDNRWCNLRECTISQNAANARMRIINNSGYRGVSWNTYMQKWQAGIKVNGKATGLGYFNSKENAALAYNFAAVKAFGEFAHFNSAEVAQHG